MRWLIICLICVGGWAGEPTLPDEARKALAAQAEKAPPVGDGPAVVGTWIWGGRADLQYKPFFEWDLRLAAGTAARPDLRARITTLGPQQEVLREGAWVELDPLAAGEQRDIAIRLNCPTFPAWRLDLAWRGGSAAFVGTDKIGIPVPLNGAEQQPVLLAIGANAEPDKRKGLVVTWWLWNLGGVPAEKVVQQVRVLDAGGATVATGEVKPTKPVPARTTLQQRLVMPKAPADYAGISVTAAHAQADGPLILEPPAPTAPDLQVTRITLNGRTATADMVNRTGQALTGAQVTLGFTHGGKLVASLVFTVPALADGTSGQVTASASADLPVWDEFQVSWKAQP